MRAPTGLDGRLATVAAATERLMVRRVPEERVVALVRDDVIDDRRRHDATDETAESAERVRTKEGVRVSTPACVIAALSAGPAVRILVSSLLALVVAAAAPASEARAIRVRTGTRRA